MRPALLAVVGLLLVPAVAHAAPTWQPDLSNLELSSTGAEAYCAKRGKGWRLPTKQELAAVGGKLPADGYLWSGEDVSAERVGQRWIMNLANGHIFNGHGYKGFAKCVKGDLPPKVEHALGKPYLTIGPVDAKVTVLVAVQPDYFWWKIRPTIDELANAHGVQFDLRVYTVTPKFEHAGIALCAAGQAGKLDDFESKLQALGTRASLDAREMRELALAAGIDGKAYDGAIATCTKHIAADRPALAQRGILAVPTFLVGKTKVQGARPDELRAAVEAAAKAAK